MPLDPRAIVVGRDSRWTVDAVPFGGATPGKETHARPATQSPARSASRASEQQEGLAGSLTADSGVAEIQCEMARQELRTARFPPIAFWPRCAFHVPIFTF